MQAAAPLVQSFQASCMQLGQVTCACAVAEQALATSATARKLVAELTHKRDAEREQLEKKHVKLVETLQGDLAALTEAHGKAERDLEDKTDKLLTQVCAATSAGRASTARRRSPSRTSRRRRPLLPKPRSKSLRAPLRRRRRATPRIWTCSQAT